MSLTGKSPSATYKDLLKVSNNNSGIDSTARTIESGNGSNTAITLSDRALKVRSFTDNTTAFTVRDAGGTTKFQVDTTNDQVKALGHHVNTQYADFGIASTLSANYAANTHHPIPFSANNQALANQDDITFGTSTDPATTFTTADGASTDASLLVPMLWYVPDAISIDAVYGIEAGSNASGDTTRMHLMSYTFTSGSTSALTSGTLLAHNSDVTNAGSEQAYLTEFTVDSASVAAGKVILAFFRSDGINSDYSVNIKVKYHLT
tara:strand:- start:20129 stop:20917 length:789 start_codon:yes stop_codon:yes gene_type:complete